MHWQPRPGRAGRRLPARVPCSHFEPGRRGPRQDLVFAAVTVDWSGDDWQEYCERLFNERHAPAGYQRVPDKDRGDLGLEGFSLDGEGCAYQCYASEATGVGERYVAQRDKMSADLRKLLRRADRVAELLGEHRIRRWIFMVPIHDSKELVIHARRKEAELRAANLDFLAPDFVIVIQTEADFPRERALLASAGAAVIGLIALEDGPVAVDQLRRNEADQVRLMDDKLARAIPAAETAIDVRERMLRAAVDEGNIRDHLRRTHPEIHEAVERKLAARRREVENERDFGQLHRGSIGQVKRQLEDALANDVPAVGVDHAERLASGTIARWLMECPLDFPEVS